MNNETKQVNRPSINVVDRENVVAFKTLLVLAIFASLLPVNFASAAQTVTYYHSNALGSPVAASNESGTLVWRKSYDPYGEKIDDGEGAANSVAFTGRKHDNVTGLTYMGARYYDPEVGRFMAIDPAGFRERSPVTYNRYAYANNNPFRFVDPDGRASFPVEGKVVITSKYGERTINGVTDDHNGLDFRNRKGRPALAAQDGTVYRIENRSRGGNSILIQNNDGSMNGFAHTAPREGLKEGDPVSEGEVIGRSDGSGTKDPHLHFTYREGTPDNPATPKTKTSDPLKTQFKDKKESEYEIDD